jgi:cytochrome c-type biogenesis protein CcmH/NrfF
VRSERWIAVAIAVALLALGAPAAATSAPQPQPQTSVHAIEGEVMCPICGTLLELADSPQARREKAYIAKLVAAGKTRSEVKDALVAQYGREVLALPSGSGFDLSAYLVPVIAILIAIAALALSVARWRREGGGSPPSGRPAGSAPQGEEAERLEADLGRYDL